MALNVKEILSDALLKLCEEKPLGKISIADIQKESTVSRQAFYNHFRDKNDLIQYIYLNRIIVNWRSTESDLDYYSSLLDLFERFAKYHVFMKQALAISDQNCLSEFMIDYCMLHYSHHLDFLFLPLNPRHFLLYHQMMHILISILLFF